MKASVKVIILLFILQTTSVSYSQNLVPNPSFELYDTCPNGQAQIHYATGWENWKYTPEYFNFCSSNFSVPNNFGGYQLAATGNAYSGIYTYETADTNVREVIAHPLFSNLTIGVKYYVSFKASLALDTNLIFNQATNNLGALFSTVPYTQFNPIPISNNAIIYSPSVITDTSNWTVISGSFIADSAYQYIAIGNFFVDVNTTVIQMQDTAFDKAAYYFIDDVCVSTDSAICDFTTDIASELVSLDKMKIYPNPVVDYINISNLNEPYDLIVYNALGQILFEEKNIINNNKRISTYQFDNGLLFVSITSQNHCLNYKLLKQ